MKDDVGKGEHLFPAPLACYLVCYPVGRVGREMQFWEPDARPPHKGKGI